MKEVMKESDHILLLSKKLTGEISPAESAGLEKWLAQSADNQRLAQEIEGLWNGSEGYGKTFSPDLNTAFQKVQARIQTSAPAPFRVTLGSKLLRAAAAVALLIGFAWAWQHYSTPSMLLVSAENGSKHNMELPDGSRFWLREGSTLSYSKSWEGKERRVKLQGEGYFEVQHDPAHPFKVELENGGSVEVLGTQFDVCQASSQTSVLVRSGKVRFSPNASSRGTVLTANQKAVFDRAAAQVQVMNLSSLNELSWQTGGLEFVNTPLEQVVRDLETYYGVKITLENPGMRGCPHSAPLTSQPIDNVLETISLTHELKLKKVGKASYELWGGKCR